MAPLSRRDVVSLRARWKRNRQFSTTSKYGHVYTIAEVDAITKGQPWERVVISTKEGPKTIIRGQPPGEKKRKARSPNKGKQ